MNITNIDKLNRTVTINWANKDYKVTISENGDIDFEDDLSEDEQDALSNFCMFNPEMEQHFPSEEF